ncbi:uncharacterized protein LOC107808133 [Nicotiana tabacum]|uniref:Uncharacterized protein LOC107808133 n=1 Tax=Nicotiana tabacum TaxID=4097 RepID=A0AC58U4F8_TOBAC
MVLESISRTTESNARRYVYNSMCKNWGAKRLKLFDKAYDPLKSRAEIMDSVPLGIPPDQWISYVDYRFKEKTQPSDAASGSISPMDIRRSSVGSNPNDNH